MVNIIIPIYKSDFENFEILSLESSFKHFSQYTITFVCPENLSLTFLNQYEFIKNYQVEFFKPDYFKNIDGYNKLLLSTEFYNRFKKDKFILICQTDVYVFENKLENWIEKNYDYVGAPWIASNRNFINTSLDSLNNLFRKVFNKKEKNIERIFKVGNGGFSLRKTEKFIEICDLEAENIKQFFLDKPTSEYHIEDVFWSLYVGKKYKNIFQIPTWQEALDFCIDRKPKLAIELNQNKLPMACHGFNKPKVQKFWINKIK